MKTNIKIFWSIAAYFTVVAILYFTWGVIDNGKIEWSGGTPLLLSAGLSGLIAFYLGLVKKNQGGELHEDIEDADIDEGDPELGHFSPWSWWPIVLAFGASAFVFGFALNGNFFIVFFSIPILIVGVVGWTYEYYRGYFAR